MLKAGYTIPPVWLAVSVIALAPSSTIAQPGRVAPATAPATQVFSKRSGLAGSLALGLGAQQGSGAFCEPACGHTTELNPRLGFSANDRLSFALALLLQVQDTDASADESLQLFSVFATARYFTHPRIWVEGGVGRGEIRLLEPGFFGHTSTKIDHGVALQAAAGFELLKFLPATLDILVRFTTILPSVIDPLTSFTFGIGLNFY